MNASSCDQVALLIDLFAANECSRDEAKLVRRHLDDCDACRESLQQSRALIATLDLHFGQDAALERLAERLHAETRRERPTPPTLRFVHRFAAVAALMFVTFGLGIWLAPRFEAASVPSVQLALALPQRNMELFPGPARGKDALKLKDLSRAQLAKAIKKADEEGDWPSPPRIEIDLVVTNTGTTPMELQLGGPDFLLLLDVRGRGVVRQTLPPSMPPLFASRRVMIAPGGTYTLPITRLASQIGDTVQNLYILEPGKYDVSARLDAVAERQGRRERVQQRAGPLRLRLP